MRTSLEIARLEESRQALAVAEVSTESVSIAGGKMCFSGKGSWTNQAHGVGLHGPVQEEELEGLVEFYISRGVEPKVELCPFAHDTLIEGLARRGFELLEFVNVLYREVEPEESLAGCMPHAWPSGLEIVPVNPRDGKAAEVFVDVTCRGFFPESEEIADVLYRGAHRNVKHPRTESFLAMMHGTPAGGGSVEITEEISGLFGGSVSPEFRRRGIQSALILRRLECAQNRKCPLVTVHAKPGSPTERNATRLGFRVAYTRATLRLQGAGLLPSP